MSESLEKVRSFFDTPEKYLHKRHGIWIRKELINNWIGAITGKNILDAGCGDGSLSIGLLKHNRVFFCDLSERMLQLVKARIDKEERPAAFFCAGSVDDLRPDVQFDVILCVGLLAHVPSVEKTILNLVKFLVPGGKLILQFSDAGHWLTRLNVRRSGLGYDVNQIHYDIIKKICTENNLILVSEVRFHAPVPGFGKLPDRLTYLFQKCIMNTPVLSRLCTDYMWLLQKK